MYVGGTGLPSWCVRYLAIVGLSRVNRTCQSLPMKDDLSNVAWRKCVERRSAEPDKRVLKAFCISQVGVLIHTGHVNTKHVVMIPEIPRHRLFLNSIILNLN